MYPTQSYKKKRKEEKESKKTRERERERQKGKGERLSKRTTVREWEKIQYS